MFSTQKSLQRSERQHGFHLLGRKPLVRLRSTIPIGLSAEVSGVTGGAQGLGFVCARALLEHGVAYLAIFDVNPECGEKALAHLQGLYQNNEPPETVFKLVDVTDEGSVDEAVNGVAQHFEGVDILLCFAGITESRLAVEYPIDSWRRIFDVNVHGSFLVARAVAR